jgi:hypothetical protein
MPILAAREGWRAVNEAHVVQRHRAGTQSLIRRWEWSTSTIPSRPQVKRQCLAKGVAMGICEQSALFIRA